MSQTDIRVVAICGSLREESYTRHALRIALQGAQSVGAQTGLIDLRAYDLVFCAGNLPDDQSPAGVVRLRQAVRQAHGVILGTPEYHGSFSGVLKNALDLMGFEEFGGKIVGLVGVSGGSMGGINALNGLRTVGRSLRAWVVPEQVTIPQAWKVFDEAGGLPDDVLRGRLLEVGRQVARFAYLHNAEETLEFLRAWENAPQNPGGDV